MMRQRKTIKMIKNETIRCAICVQGFVSILSTLVYHADFTMKSAHLSLHI